MSLRTRNTHPHTVRRVFSDAKLSNAALHRAAILPSRSALTATQREAANGGISLLFTGTLDAATLNVFRDAVFRAIGERPPLLCLDLSLLTDPLDSDALQVLVTAAHVARRVDVSCCIVAGDDIRETLRASRLDRLLLVTAH